MENSSLGVLCSSLTNLNVKKYVQGIIKQIILNFQHGDRNSVVYLFVHTIAQEVSHLL
jgi:hypothetical protein